jgi:shikimate dehydrogenase
MVEHAGLTPAGKKVLVLGSGGASNTAVRVMEEMGANVVIISRTGDNNYTNLHLHRDASIIVNATPVGMFPNNGTSPLSLDGFPKLEGVLDMIYNPSRTKLLLEAAQRGLVAENGLWMLVAQAKEAAEWFTGSQISDEVIGLIHKTLSVQMENIILIGMPGCGKSTIASFLAQRTNRKLLDADMAIAQKAGKSIPELFAQDGEAVFRQIETEVLSDFGKQSGCIISTGGGCVTQERNYPLLHQNGTIFWLQRDLNLLPTDGRPLSQANKLSEMYSVRKPMYQYFSDYTIDNNGSPEATVGQILSILEV